MMRCDAIYTMLSSLRYIYSLHPDTKAQLLFNATYVIESDISPHMDATKQVQWQQHFQLKRPTSSSPPPVGTAASLLSFIHYFGMDCDAADDQPLCFSLGKDIRDIDVQLVDAPTGSSGVTRVTVTGFSSLSGWFMLTYTATDLATDSESTPLKITYYGPKAKRKRGGSGLPITIDKIHRAKDFMNAKKNSRRTKALSPASDEGILFDDSGDLPNVVESNAVGVFVQFLSVSPLEIQVEFSSDLTWESKEDVQTAGVGASRDFSDTVQSLVKQFDEQFEERFHLGGGGKGGEEQAQGGASFSEQHVEVARRAMSALLGGLGYFHGSPLTGDALKYGREGGREAETEEAAALPPNVLTLFSGTPSRSSFPRGFLWDEVSVLDSLQLISLICSYSFI